MLVAGRRRRHRGRRRWAWRAQARERAAPRDRRGHGAHRPATSTARREPAARAARRLLRRDRRGPRLDHQGSARRAPGAFALGRSERAASVRSASAGARRRVRRRRRVPNESGPFGREAPRLDRTRTADRPTEVSRDPSTIRREARRRVRRRGGRAAADPESPAPPAAARWSRRRGRRGRRWPRSRDPLRRLDPSPSAVARRRRPRRRDRRAEGRASGVRRAAPRRRARRMPSAWRRSKPRLEDPAGRLGPPVGGRCDGGLPGRRRGWLGLLVTDHRRRPGRGSRLRSDRRGGGRRLEPASPEPRGRRRDRSAPRPRELRAGRARRAARPRPRRGRRPTAPAAVAASAPVAETPRGRRHAAGAAAPPPRRLQQRARPGPAGPDQHRPARRRHLGRLRGHPDRLRPRGGADHRTASTPAQGELAVDGVQRPGARARKVLRSELVSWPTRPWTAR